MKPRKTTTTTSTIRHIVCATDWSAASLNAVGRALKLASSLGADVTLLHVIPGKEGSRVSARVRSQARRDLEAVKQSMASPDVRVKTRIDEGAAWAGIQSVARAEHADLVVMGTTVRGILGVFALGSTMEKVLRAAPCAVLAVPADARPAYDPLFRRVLCAVSLSRESRKVVRAATLVTEKALGELTILNVIEPPGVEWAPALPPSLSPDPYVGRVRKAALARLVNLGRAVPKGPRVQTRVDATTPWRAITKAAKELDAQLIVLGAQRGRGLAYFVGSTVLQTVLHAHCPVLVVK